MGTWRNDPRSRRGRGVASLIAFLLLFAFALGQGGSLMAFADDAPLAESAATEDAATDDARDDATTTDADAAAEAEEGTATDAGSDAAEDTAAEDSGAVVDTIEGAGSGLVESAAPSAGSNDDGQAAGASNARQRPAAGGGGGSTQQLPDEAGDPSGNGVQPVLLSGNRNCAEVLGADLLFEYRLEPVDDATVDLAAESGGDVEGTLVVDVHGDLFDFTIEDGDPLAAVVVKGGNNADLYDYRPAGEVADTDLHAPLNADSDQYYGLSHISFCWAQEKPQPAIDVEKSCPASVPFGEDIEYTITVENTGNEALVDVTVDDTLLGDITDQFDFDFSQPFPEGTVATAQVTYSPGVNEDPVENTVTASATGAESDQDTSDEASCETDVSHEAAIDVSKTCEEFAAEGDVVTYSITVENTGNEDLEGVAVTDTILGDLSGFSATLAVGASETLEFEYTVPRGGDDPLINEVTASGSGVDSGATVTATASCSTDILHPAIDIVKTVSDDLVPVGTTVTYTYVVTNTGDTPLYDITVDDDVMGHIGDIPFLDVGESATLTKDFVVGQDQVVNVATARGHDILGREVSASDDAVVNPIAGERPNVPPSIPPSTPPSTPFTGSEAGRLAVVAMILLAVGATLVALTRRRRQAPVTTW